MASASPISKPNPRILIVEDEPALRFLVTTALEDDGGFHLLVAESADEALEIIAQTDGIDCVFTDVRMPGKYDGIDLANEILAVHPAIKVIITSGNNYPGPPLAGVPFVPKPYDLAGIPKTIRNAMAS